jgi:phosphosulfolactate phosphohydrolase-like enzyme
MGLPIPGLDKALGVLSDPNGPLAKQAAASETLAGALIASSKTYDNMARSNFVLAESNNRLAQALEDSTRAGRR